MNPARAVKTAGGLKKVNKARERVGLPDLEFKSINRFQDTTWVSPSATTWAFNEDLQRVAIGATDETRESNKIKFLPTKFRMRIRQPQNTEHDYRILIVKDFDKAATALQPTDIFTNAGYWEFCGYKRDDDRNAGKERWKVLYDKCFRFSTHSGRASTKYMWISLPTANVTFDQDDTTGITKTNALRLYVYTDATPSTGTYTMSYEFNYKFLDQ